MVFKIKEGGGGRERERESRWSIMGHLILHVVQYISQKNLTGMKNTIVEYQLWPSHSILTKYPSEEMCQLGIGHPYPMLQQ